MRERHGLHPFITRNTISFSRTTAVDARSPIHHEFWPHQLFGSGTGTATGTNTGCCAATDGQAIAADAGAATGAAGLAGGGGKTHTPRPAKNSQCPGVP